VNYPEHLELITISSVSLLKDLVRLLIPVEITPFDTCQWLALPIQIAVNHLLVACSSNLNHDFG